MPSQVSNYLRYAIRQFCRRRGRPPADQWHSIPRAGIHALLRMVRGKWPPESPPVNAGEAACRAVCREYDDYLRDERGLAEASIDALMWEGRHFLSWYVERVGAAHFRNLSIKDIDAYFEMRARHLRRRSLKDVAERLRSLARFLYRSGRIGIDLAPRIISPIMYAYESIPSALTEDQIACVLKNTRKDRSPLGLRDYAILLLLSTYGMRSRGDKAAADRGHRLASWDFAHPPFEDGRPIHNCRWFRRLVTRCLIICAVDDQKQRPGRSSFAREHLIARWFASTARSAGDWRLPA